MSNSTGPSGFLKFNSLPPRLHVTADDDEFDEVLLQHFRQEGFDVTYLPCLINENDGSSGKKAYVNELKHLADDLEVGESYAIIAFNQAAAICLDFYSKPQPHFAALVCYYPTYLPNPKISSSYPTNLHLLIHLSGTQPFAPDSSTSSSSSASPHAKSYSYPKALVGFAEHDLEPFDKIAAGLAWTRTLATLRTAFKRDRDDGNGGLEGVRERYVEKVFGQKKDAQGVMGMVGQDSYVNGVPTMTGGIGRHELFVFYRDYFIPKNPPSLHIKLVSRTIGTDQVVDEMIISFKHTQEVPWLLPGVQATNKIVHVAVVSIVASRGGKLVHEHLYWDQASVLVQVGLLDPKLVPEAFKKQGLKRLPVFGSETAAKVLDENSQPSNGLISGWKQSLRKQEESQALPQRPKQTANSH